MAKTELPAATSARDAIRDAIIGGPDKTKTKIVEFFGQEIELRQPSMEVIMNMQASEGDRAASMANMIINYSYVPGTLERIFEEADAEALTALPFGADVQRIQRAINELTSLDIKAAEGNSEETSSDTSSSE